MAIRKTAEERDASIRNDFGPFLDEENAIAFYRVETEANGITRRSRYCLQIINTLVQNDQTLFKRIPPQARGGIAQGGRRNAEATVVARANEGPVRPQPGGTREEARREGQRPGDENRNGGLTEDPLFERWDRQEAALEAWARADGCWNDNLPGYAEAAFGEIIDKGTEARVYRYDGDSVAKVISCPFDVQQTLDRITLTNYVFPETGLELLGMGRGEDGEFCFLVKQPFIKGQQPEGDTVELAELEEFSEVTQYKIPPDYATPEILLGDLHDRNILIGQNGKAYVIDCNIFLNTPDMRRGGRWIIPELTFNEEGIRRIRQELDELLPKTAGAEKLFPRLETLRNGITGEIDGKGFLDGTLSVPLKDGTAVEILIQKNPDNPSQVLYMSPLQAEKMIRHAPGFSSEQKAALAFGKTIKADGRDYRFDLDKGRIEELTSEALKRKIKQKSDRTPETKMPWRS